MPDEYLISIVNTVTSIFAIFIAIYALHKEGKRARFSQGIEILLDMGKHFNSVEFKNERKKTATLMEEISRIAQTGSEFDYSLIDHNVKSEVLDFFQTIGNLTKNKILDLDFVWRDYSYWLIHYWEFFKGAIERDREYGDYFWEDAEWLYNQFKQKYRNKKFIVNFKGFIEFENNCA